MKNISFLKMIDIEDVVHSSLIQIIKLSETFLSATMDIQPSSDEDDNSKGY